jgi:ABC-type glycerol-3-phosphate transport system substrate-binding protein
LHEIKTGDNMNKYTNICFFIVFTVLVLTGCAAPNLVNNYTPPTGQPISVKESIAAKSTNKLLYYVDNLYSFTENFTVMQMTNDSIIGSSIEDEKLIITVLDSVTKEVKLKTILPISAKEAYISNLAVGNQGNIYILATDYQETGFDQYFWKMDGLGNLEEMIIPTFEDTTEGSLQTIQKIEIDSTGTLYFWVKTLAALSSVKEDAKITQEQIDEYTTQGVIDSIAFEVDRIYIMDEKLNTLYYAQIVNMNWESAQDISLNKEGIPEAIVKTSEGIFLRELDRNTHKFKDAVPLMQTNVSELSMIVPSVNGFFYTQGDILFQYEKDSSTPQKILNWSTYGINPSEILYLRSHNGSIEVIDNSNTNANTELIVLKEGSGDKTVLSLGVLMEDETMTATVRSFNRSNPNYILVIEYYTQDGDFDQGLEALKLDLVTGNAPDIIDVSTIDYAVFADKGIFTDLNTFMSQDTDCNQDTLVDSVVQAYNMDGHIYTLAPAFQLYSIWGKASVTGNKDGCTLNDLMELLQKQGKDVNAIFGFSADEPVMTTLCTFGMNEFINWGDMSCDFTGDYFKDLAVFTKAYTGGYAGSTSEGIKDGDILLTIGMISNVAAYQLQESLYGSDLSFIGYPATSGNGTAIGFRGTKLAINGSSAQQEAAWAFMKYYLLHGYDGQGFPIRKDSLDTVLQKAQEPNIVTDMDGTYEMPQGTYMDEDTFLEVYGASAEDVAAVRQLITEAKYRYEYNTDILNIIQEEITPYLSGSKPIDGVADVIQSRVQLYLKEQMD